jgi:hypothetical protein
MTSWAFSGGSLRDVNGDLDEQVGLVRHRDTLLLESFQIE